jgi:hypothetical protein
MADLVVFSILIPLTDNATGIVHAPEKFDRWLLETAEQFGGATVMATALRGLWYDPELPPGADPVEDYSNLYKVGVSPSREDELREHAKKTAVEFGQKCVYFERTGEADFVWDPAHDPSRGAG